MNLMELILDYKNYIDGIYGLSLTTKELNIETLLNELENNLLNEEEFKKVKSLILQLNAYPIFIYCAKKYPNTYYDFFNKHDTNISTELISYLIDTMIYYSSSDYDTILKEANLSDTTVDIKDISTVYNNKLIALHYYNPALFKVLHQNALKYVDTYNQELHNFNKLNDLQFINSFFKLFCKGQTYHFKYKLINKLYLYLDSAFKYKVKEIIDTALISSNDDIIFFKEDFEDLHLAYKFKNR